MKILIIEDEQQAAWNLRSSIEQVQPDALILGITDSLANTRKWFQKNELPDLIFSDIQLGDGIIFDLFNTITLPCPVIFCTAYDEYLLQAFKSNGIDYLLKPIDEAEVRRSFDKLSLIRKPIPDNRQSLLDKAIVEILERKQTYKNIFLIPHRDKMLPIETENIVYFKVTEKASELGCLDGKTYHHSFTLDYLATVLNPEQFYRASRQYLVSFHAISEIEHHDERKLLIHMKAPNKEQIVVSKAKATAFLDWMQRR